MQAVAYTAYGGPEVMQLVSAPVPVPRAGEVLVRVAAGGLNPVDKLQRAGMFKAFMPFSFPAIGGNEFSGTVAGLGEGVTRFSVGDAVICRVTKTEMRALAEYTTMPADICAPAPKSVPLTTAAGLPLAGLTAEQCLDHLDVQAGERLLVTGGAGGVGQFAIQLAKLRGAHVSTTASDAGRPFVLKAGADEVINYHTTKLADLPQKFDKVLDAAGGDDALMYDVVPSVREGGRIISVAGPPTPGCLDGLMSWWMRPAVNVLLWTKSRALVNAAAAVGVEYKYIFMVPNGEQLAHLAALVDQGKLAITVDSRFKMAEFKQAFERLESGRSKGKVIVEFAGDQ
ncbi:GroES-like protein [Cutaneotrichosporon oleaginosum]|uniref:GroES-like protein n=1 Tax=Cutaneotrichosporon oleaginosum TaxID=879819 RepID=A0A0J0XEM4_9TREE|nr:GroES-like protein [Cutaneotrichosporon oleaginosum]KLT39520.1 GroES-like protein [Cutaneotrichosporon oleaginosum]TXT07081.1 hypothetical protein COLE_06412 [Cutaneotrichosporon oleaginosum]